MPRIRTTKALARRIDLSYFKKPHPFRRARLLLVLACCVAALAWWGVSYTRAREAMYNPGPVTHAHAMWGNDCSVCHKTEGNGKFVKAVSDSACLQCHDGAIHSTHQVSLVSTASDGRLRSGNCVSCHVEHRGHDLLAATSDSVCTRCHADLKSHDNEPPAIAERVTLFSANEAKHPHFGRSLTPAGKPVRQAEWVDPTVLKFNHKVHTEKVKALEGLTENCTVCHRSGRPEEAGTQPQSLGDGRYMQPVRYERDCAQCHPLQLTDTGPALPHEAMPIVRQTLGNVPLMYSQWLSTQSADDRAKLLTVVVPGKLGRKATTKTITADEWAKQQVGAVEKTVGAWLDDDGNATVPGFNELKAALKASAGGDDAHPSLTPSALELFVARGGLSKTSCNYCHGVSGVPQVVLESQATAGSSAAAPAPAAPAADAGAGPAATTEAASQPSDATASSQPTTQPAEHGLLATVPTGIPHGPRRWFTSSNFDHRAHRNMSCVSCHPRALTSEKTSDVLSPDVTWQDASGKTVSCPDCHHPSHGQTAGAANHCTTCHEFHDRSKERSPDGVFDVTAALTATAPKPAPPATQPVASAQP